VEEQHIDGIVASGWRVRKGGPIRQIPSEVDLRVLAWASHGLTDEMVADVMGLSHYPVKTHIRTAIALLKAKNKLHAVAICLREGYLN